MYKLTDNRFAKVNSVLERYRSELVSSGDVNTNLFEHELKRLLDLGYQEIKDILIDIVNRYHRYKYVALYFMQYSNPTGPVMEFKSTLASAYNLRHFDLSEVDARSKAFWREAIHEMKQEDAEPLSHFKPGFYRTN